MEESRDAILARLEELSRAVCELERRTSVLERRGADELSHSPVLALPPAPAPLPDSPAPAMAQAGGELALEGAGSLGPLFGWALMGIAGAYLLRALTEAGAIPGVAGVAAGIVYAAWWLFLAERRAWEKPLFSTVHGLTAALILAPMLWEMSVRFHLISVTAASGVVVLFAVLGLAIAWRRNISSIAWIVTAAGLITSTALFRESHDARVWVGTILAIAIAVEISACRDHWLSLRWMVALAADLSVLFLAFLGSRPAGSGQVVEVGPAIVLVAQIALLTIYLASTVDRTLLRGLNISGFEIGQAAVAFLISIGGALQTVGAGGSGAFTIGIFCLLGGAACYMVSFAFLDKDDRRDRNFHTYSAFALLLVMAGCQTLLSGAWLAGAWAALAAAMMAVGFARDRGTLRVHAAAYLLLAVATARLLQLASAQIARTSADALPPMRAPYLLALAGAIGCYAAILSAVRLEKRPWTDRVEAILVAAVVVWGVAGLLAGALSTWVSAAPPLRMALLTALASAAAWAGARWDRAELDRLAWPLMGVAAIKLLAEDFPQGKSHNLVLSLILFGGGLILLPRLMREKRPAAR